MADLINSTVSTATLMRRVVREMVEALGAAGGLIALPEDVGEGLRVEHSQELDDTRYYKVDGVLPHENVAARDDVEGAVQQAEARKHAGTWEMAAPLRLEGQVAGALLVRGKRGQEFAEADEAFMMALAVQAGRIIQTARLYERLNRQIKRLETLFETGQRLISTEPLPEVLNRVTDSLLSIIDVKQCTVLLVGKGHDLQLSAASGAAGHYTQRREGMDSLVEKLSARGEPVRVLDVRKMEGRRPGKLPKAERMSSLLAVPIFYREQLVGILNVYTEKPREFDPEEMRLLKAYANICGVAIENARQHEHLLAVAEEVRTAGPRRYLAALGTELATRVRNPLAACRLLLDTLHEAGAFPPGHGEDYEVLTGAVAEISAVVGRVEAMGGRRQPQLEWLDVNRMVEDVIALCQHKLAARQVMINRRFTADLPRVLADRGEVQEVLLQCVLNAMDSMRHGGILHFATTLLAGPEDRGGKPMVRINIRDTGAGLGALQTDEIFDPFSRPATMRAGISLFVASRIVQKYGGWLTARNATDHGASTSITLPALEQQQ